jgi:bifunctional DNA-binding transcriptional regulator/antitoxin component of YhaV-PrlF toxin-antitoxin module
MGRKKIRSEDESTRKITRTGGYTYYVTLPKEELETLGWREGESVKVRRKGRRMVIEKK